MLQCVDVPADPHLVELVASGHLTTARATGAVLVSSPGAVRGQDLRIAHGDDGACVFREGQRCTIHAQRGESALPVSCRHYPRVILRDRLHTRISSSHYCPTAVSMLFAPGALTIVDAAGRLAIDEPLEGLDAREALPPLLRPGMLMDLAGYEAWEAECVATFASEDDGSRALNVITRATDIARAWTPNEGALVDMVAAAFRAARTESTTETAWDASIGGAILRSLVKDPPTRSTEIRRGFRTTWSVPSPITFAARVFGNWISYQGRGLRTVVAWLHACHDLVRAFARDGHGYNRSGLVSAIRDADFIMLHTIDSQAFARAAVLVEN